MEYWTFLRLFLLLLLSDCTFAQVLLKLKLNRIIISKIVLQNGSHLEENLVGALFPFPLFLDQKDSISVMDVY